MSVQTLETGSVAAAVHVLTDEQSPRIMVPVLVKELLCRVLVVRVSDLTVPEE